MHLPVVLNGELRTLVLLSDGQPTLTLQ
jgi:hypothetical protein